MLSWIHLFVPEVATMRINGIVWCSLACFSWAAYADGPADRKPTEPLAITSASGAASAQLPVEALLTTTRISGIGRSNDGRMLVYTSNTSGRPNLWLMNADGTAPHQLVTNDDRQTGARFIHDDGAIVYSQDRGGNEYYDIYEVPVNGGEPRNLHQRDGERVLPRRKAAGYRRQAEDRTGNEPRRDAVAQRRRSPAYP
jgi:hypothetical protein